MENNLKMNFPIFNFYPTSERKYLNVALKVKNNESGNAHCEMITDYLHFPIAFMVWDSDSHEYKYFMRGDVH